MLGREVPFPSLADVGHLAAPPLAAAALITLPFTARTLAGRVRQVLDGLMIAASLLLDRAKAAGQGGYDRHDPSCTPSSCHASSSRPTFAAPRQGELFLHFQPTIDLASGPDRRGRGPGPLAAADPGAGPPTEFLPGRGLGPDPAPGTWGLREACRQAAARSAAPPTGTGR